MANGARLTPLEKASIITTVVLVIVLGVLAGVSGHYGWWLALAVSVGGLGGLAHEVAQSGGKILFFERRQDGMYLGAVAGIVLGAVAGILVTRGHLLATTAEAPAISAIQLSYEVFFAGLGLKGVAEAAGGNPVQ